MDVSPPQLIYSYCGLGSVQWSAHLRYSPRPSPFASSLAHVGLLLSLYVRLRFSLSTVPSTGLEPATNGLRGHCSTVELRGHMWSVINLTTASEVYLALINSLPLLRPYVIRSLPYLHQLDVRCLSLVQNYAQGHSLHHHWCFYVRGYTWPYLLAPV